MIVASGRTISSPRVKLRVSLATVTVIVGSSACARPGSRKKQSRTRARMMSPSPTDVGSLQHLNQTALVVGKVGRIGIMRGRQLRRPLDALEMTCALLRHALDRES